MHNLQPGIDYPARIGSVLSEIWDQLPERFSRGLIIEIANERGRAPITVDSYLRRLLEAGRIERVAYGIYEKI